MTCITTSLTTKIIRSKTDRQTDRQTDTHTGTGRAGGSETACVSDPHVGACDEALGLHVTDPEELLVLVQQGDATPLRAPPPGGAQPVHLALLLHPPPR